MGSQHKTHSNKTQLAAGVVVLSIFGLVFYSAAQETIFDAGGADSAEQKEHTQQPKEQVSLSPRDEMREKLNTMISNGSAYAAEDYIKGDVPAGEYVFMPTTLSYGYYSEEDGAGNILDNENFDSFGYVQVHSTGNLTTDGGLVPVGSLSQLGVNGAKELFETLHEKSNYSEAGYYKAGVDIPAGNYVLESYGEAYVSVLSGPVGSSEIIDNDIFNGKYSVSLADGQYLSFSRAKIILD